jgi:hypothetical protein
VKKIIGLAVVLVASACVVNVPPPSNSAPPASDPNVAPAADPAAPAPLAASDAGAPAPATLDAGKPVVVDAGTADASIEVKPFAETTDPSDPAKEGKRSVADGRPKAYKAGVPESYWVWQDEKGSGWHLRMSTKDNLHRFNGFISGDADLKNVKSTRTEWSDRLKHSGKRAAFDLYVLGVADGIDFQVAGNGCVRFYLLIDGKPADASRINLGKDAAHPEKAHFKLCN